MLNITFVSHMYIWHRLLYIQYHSVNDVSKFLTFCTRTFLDGTAKSTVCILFRLLTYKWRVLPTVIVLGEQKCGTTTFAHYLRIVLNMEGPFSFLNHPIVDGKDSVYLRGLYGQYASPLYYSMCFPLKCLSNTNIMHFDACPSYLYLPFIRDRILKLHEMNPNHPFKFIIITRNPIDRAISNIKSEITFQHMTKQWGAVRNSQINSVTEMIDFCQTEQFIAGLEALKNIKWNEKLPDFFPMIERSGIIQKGMYHENIKWLFQHDLFKNNTLILDLKELSDSPATVMRNAAEFIGIDTSNINFDDVKKVHLNKHSERRSDKEHLSFSEGRQMLQKIYSYDYKEKLSEFMFSHN